MVILYKDRRRGIRGKVAEKPFPGSTRDCKELARRVGNELFQNMEMVGISLRLLTPPSPKGCLGE